MPDRLRPAARRHRPASLRSGFTLIELIAVIVIIGILAVFLLPRLMGATDTVKAGNTKKFFAQLSAALTAYELDEGDYPPSTFPNELDAPNRVNMGSEILVVTLFGPDRIAPDLGDERIGNTDADRTKTPATSFPKPDLFEILDDWQNPIAYIHRRDYGKEFQYQTEAGASSELIVNTVRAIKNPVTETWFNAKSYQLISAGGDGEFGTSDDVFNFEYENE